MNVFYQKINEIFRKRKLKFSKIFMNSVSFILDNSVIKFNLSKKLFQEIPDNKESIYNDLFNRHEYYVQSKVSKEIFQTFLEYWANKTFPEINSGNILDYYQLNLEFGFLDEYFSSEKIKEPVYNLSYLLVMKKDSVSNINEIEKKIAQNLDVYLDGYSNELCKIPITILYNIFYHPERNLKNEDNAYKFIVKSGENNQSFFILLGSLDAKKFTDKGNKRDSVYNKQKHFGFAPKNAEDSIDEVEKENKSLFENLELSKKNISEIQSQLQDLKQQKSDLNNQITDHKKEISNLNSQLIKSKEINSDLQNKLDAQSKRIADLEKMLNDNSFAISDLNKRNSELSMQATKLNKTISDLEEKIKKGEKEKLETNQKFLKLKSKMKSINDKIFNILLFFI